MLRVIARAVGLRDRAEFAESDNRPVDWRVESRRVSAAWAEDGAGGVKMKMGLVVL